MRLNAVPVRVRFRARARTAVWTLAWMLATLLAQPVRAEHVPEPPPGEAATPSIYALDTLVPTQAPLASSAEGGADLAGGEVTEVFDQGMASWYGGRFHGRRTASGERFDMYALTAAHPTLPFGTRIKVRRLDTGQEVEVRINDRGPHARGRILDLSRAAAEALGVLQSGASMVALVLP
jgi:rare lipoprotein A